MYVCLCIELSGYLVGCDDTICLIDVCLSARARVDEQGETCNPCNVATDSSSSHLLCGHSRFYSLSNARMLAILFFIARVRLSYFGLSNS